MSNYYKHPEFYTWYISAFKDNIIYNEKYKVSEKLSEKDFWKDIIRLEKEEITLLEMADKWEVFIIIIKWIDLNKMTFRKMLARERASRMRSEAHRKYYS